MCISLRHVHRLPARSCTSWFPRDEDAAYGQPPAQLHVVSFQRWTVLGDEGLVATHCRHANGTAIQ